MRKTEKRHRDDLTGEHYAGDAGQIILFVLFMAAWITDTAVHYSDFPTLYISLPVRITLAVIFFLISGYMAATGLYLVFLKKREDPSVIRSGVFRLVRHPVYLSEILLYLGFLMVNISLASVAIWIIVIVFLHYISRYEEKLLLARFGEDYKRYIADVPMWLPVPRRKPGSTHSNLP